MKIITTYAERQWYAGMLSVMCIQSLLQDLWGQEEMVRRMQENWIDWKITVPIALVVWIGSAFWSRRRKDDPID